MDNLTNGHLIDNKMIYEIGKLNRVYSYPKMICDMGKLRRAYSYPNGHLFDIENVRKIANEAKCEENYMRKSLSEY